MYLIIKSVVFLMLISIIRGEINNKIEVSSTCDEIEQRKAELYNSFLSMLNVINMNNLRLKLTNMNNSF